MITAKDCNQEPYGLWLLLLRALGHAPEGPPPPHWGRGNLCTYREAGVPRRCSGTSEKGTAGLLSFHTRRVEHKGKRIHISGQLLCQSLGIVTPGTQPSEAGRIPHILLVSRASQSAKVTQCPRTQD